MCRLICCAVNLIVDTNDGTVNRWVVIVDYRGAVDRLLACGVSMAEIAAEAGMQHQTIRATRLDPSSASYRRPPDDWPAILRRVATSRAADLDACSADLKALANELTVGLPPPDQ